MATTLFELLGRVALDNSSANKGIKETTGIAESASQKINAAFEKVGHAAVAVGKTIATGMAAGAAAIGALTKASIEGYAEYEQLVGGVETLFKDSQGKVMRYAENAYKTAGMSANEYMSTVTSFSASLLQSLDGDTTKAAVIANQAITDMSDNANKMGTDISMIQNAYQGFAKQNYTMLDNLKLGYGGTATEMARLINDSGVLGDAMIDLADTQNIGAALAEVGYAKMIQAIHVVQTEMGITGTTAKEAASTISGSLASAKAAWQNLLVGVADDQADFEQLIDNFVETVGIAAGNIVPRIEVALEGAGKLIDRLLPIIIDKVPQAVQTFLPKITQSAVSIVQSLVDGISKNQKMLSSTALDACMTFISAVTKMLPQIIQLGLDVLVSLATGIVEHLDELTSAAEETIGQIIEILTNDNSVDALIDAALAIVVAIADGVVKFLPKLTDAATRVVGKIVEIVSEDSTLSALLDAAIAVVMAIADFIIDNVTLLVDAAIKIVIKLVEFLLEQENLEKLIDAAIGLLEALVSGLLDNLGLLIEGAASLTGAFVEAILGVNWIEVGGKIIVGVVQGIVNAWNNFVSEHSFAAGVLENLGNALMAGGMGDALVGSFNTTPIPTTPTGTKNPTAINPLDKPGYKPGVSGSVAGSHADGLAYVPYDGYIAELHRGEMVVPAEESRFLRSGAFGNGEVLQMLERILYAVQDSGNATMSLKLNEREFARAVKAVN